MKNRKKIEKEKNSLRERERKGGREGGWEREREIERLLKREIPSLGGGGTGDGFTVGGGTSVAGHQ